MNICRFLFIPFITIALLLSGCSKSEESGKDEHAVVNQKEYWTCTMHPQVHMDRPGTCPICGMDLIKKVVDEKEQPANDKDMTNMVTLSGKKQVLANISTVIVKKENTSRTSLQHTAIWILLRTTAKQSQRGSTEESKSCLLIKPEITLKKASHCLKSTVRIWCKRRMNI